MKPPANYHPTTMLPRGHVWNHAGVHADVDEQISEYAVRHSLQPSDAIPEEVAGSWEVWSKGPGCIARITSTVRFHGGNVATFVTWTVSRALQ